MSHVPDDLKFTPSHEWVRVDGEEATIGITDHAQSELGDIVYVELPEVGRSLAKGDVFGSVESVKTVSDLYAPVSGEVVAVNLAINARTELLNSDPYGEGFLVRIRMSDPSDADALLDAAGYAPFAE